MLSRIARLALRSPKRVLVIAGLLLVLAGIYGFSVAGSLSSGGFDDPHSQSSQAADLLQKTFNAGSANLILEVTAPDGATSPEIQCRRRLCRNRRLSTGQVCRLRLHRG